MGRLIAVGLLFAGMAAAQYIPAGGGGGGAAAIACAAAPGNTVGSYRQQCQTGAGALWACNNAASCTVAADWVAAAGAAFTFPGAGVPNSTGAAWGASFALDTDATMAANSDTSIASQKAAKAALALKAPVAIYPNSAPAPAQLGVGNAGGTAYAPVSLTQDCTIASTGVVTCLKTNNVAFGTAAVVNTGSSGATIPLLNGTNTWSGAHTFSSTINKITFTPPATGSTLTIPDGVTLTGPPASATVATLGLTNALTGRQDATGAASTSPMKTGTSLPGTCIVGDLFFKSDATAGQNIYQCQSTNTWTQQLNGGGGGLTMTAGVWDPFAGSFSYPEAQYRNTANGMADWSNGAWSMYQFTIPASMALTKLWSAQFGDGAGGDVFVVGVFADSSNAPGTKITGSEGVKVGNTGAYVDVAWAPSVTLAAGTYWIGYSKSSATANWYQNNGPGTFVTRFSGLLNGTPARLVKCTNTVTYAGSSTVLPTTCTVGSAASNAYPPIIGIEQ